MYLRDLKRQGNPWPDMIVVATDSNCADINERVKEIRGYTNQSPVPVVLAIPDPHVERWLLLDGAAFKVAVGHGCNAPDQKCDRDRYKQLLIEAVRDAGVVPLLGGLEYAEDIVRLMEIERAAGADKSFARFVDDLTVVFREWRS